jgi:hypothetical protein
MFECKEEIGPDGIVLRHKGDSFVICSSCVSESKQLKVILKRDKDGVFEVAEMVGS